MFEVYILLTMSLQYNIDLTEEPYRFSRKTSTHVSLARDS